MEGKNVSYDPTDFSFFLQMQYDFAYWSLYCMNCICI